MSLSDALLLDSAKLEVWIALRTDGVKGSGTESDPYDGSVRTQPLFAVTSLTRQDAEHPTTAVAQTGTINHGYAAGDIVTVAGATGTGAGYYNGVFRLVSATLTTFTYQMSQDPGGDAQGGNITSQLDPHLFDAWLVRTGADTTVRIGPGIFDTKGSDGWQPKSGQRIHGSGMDVTVLKVTGNAERDHGFKAIGGGGFLNGFEASDFTVDCNLAGQPAQAGYDFPPVVTGACSVTGKHVRFRRIRAINFGTQTSAAECFIFYAGNAGSDTEGVDCRIEDCIVEQPSPNNVRETTCIMIISGERSTDGFMAFDRACALRKNVVDCEYQDRPVAVASLTINTGTGIATAVTRTPHGRQTGDWVRISGALENGSGDTTYNGAYPITRLDDVTFTYTPYDGAGHPRPTVNAIGDIWVGKWTSHYVRVSSITKSGSGPWTLRITTAAPHYRVPGNNVAVSGATPPVCNGAFTISNVLNPYQLEYVVTSDPQNPSGSSARLGVSFHALTADGGTMALVEDNRVFNCTFGVYHDTWSSRDLTIRDNEFRAVLIAVHQNLAGISSTTQSIPLVTTVRLRSPVNRADC